MFDQGRTEGGCGHAVQIRDVFSLRDKIGTCPNIKVEIDVTDKSSFL